MDGEVLVLADLGHSLRELEVVLVLDLLHEELGRARHFVELVGGFGVAHVENVVHGWGEGSTEEGGGD